MLFINSMAVVALCIICNFYSMTHEVIIENRYTSGLFLYPNFSIVRLNLVCFHKGNPQYYLNRIDICLITIDRTVQFTDITLILATMCTYQKIWWLYFIYTSKILTKPLKKKWSSQRVFVRYRISFGYLLCNVGKIYETKFTHFSDKIFWRFLLISLVCCEVKIEKTLATKVMHRIRNGIKTPITAVFHVFGHSFSRKNSNIEIIAST